MTPSKLPGIPRGFHGPIPVRCKNLDHEAVGLHDLEGEGYSPSCDFKFEVAWARDQLRAGKMDSSTFLAIAADDKQNWGHLSALERARLSAGPPTGPPREGE